MNANNHVKGNRQPARSWRQRGFLSTKQAIVLLILLFLAPTFVALVVHQAPDVLVPEGTTNRGTLVHPARPLELPQEIVLGEQPLSEYLQGRWTLVYIGDADCDATCRENLYKMRQVRIAQNEHMKRVQRLYIVSSGEFSDEVSAYLAEEQGGLDVIALSAGQLDRFSELFGLDTTPVESAERVYFVDPLGNLMMYYQPDADAGGMLKDLKKLLKFSRIG